MKIAVLGAGSIGSRHIRNLIALGVPASDILAIDRDPVALEKLPDGIVRFNGVHHSTEAVDARLICTPAKRHHLDIKDAIDDRVAFFVEKPATLGVSELTEAEWQTDVPHLVGYNWRWHRDYRRVRALATMAERTRLLCVTDISKWKGSSYDRPIFECSHEIDLALSLFGPVEWSPGMAITETGAEIQLTHESGQDSTIALRWGGSSLGPQRKITLTFPWAEGGTGYADQATYYAAIDGPKLDQTYVDEMKHFLAVVRGEEKSVNTLSQAKRVVEICEQAEKMASVSR